VVDRFWDTTKTFHLPFGVMTITPFNFARLTCLYFSENPLVYRKTSIFSGTIFFTFLAGHKQSHSRELIFLWHSFDMVTNDEFWAKFSWI